MVDSMHHTSCFDCGFQCFNTICSKEDLELINNNKSYLKFTREEPIIRQGGFVSQVLFLKKGLVKKVLEGGNNKNTIIKLIEHGNFVALPVLGENKKYPFSIMAVNECEVCLISKECLVEVRKRDYLLNDYLLNWYSNDYLFMYNKMSVMSTRNSHGKVASSLLYLTNGNFKSNVLTEITRKDLAELSSTSVESSNKILQQLNHDGIIDILKNNIRINRRDLLEKLSTVG